MERGPSMRYALLKDEHHYWFVEMPKTHMYQLLALLRRLHKEVGKLTVEILPKVPHPVAEFSNLELLDAGYRLYSGIEFITELENTFVALKESNYPLISLLTEIRALQAQLEQWYEEQEEGLY
jgi:hypothetical protein